MRNLECILCFVIFILCQACMGNPTCSEIASTSETISDSFVARGYEQHHRCWKIFNHERNMLYFHLKKLYSNNAASSAANITFGLKDERTGVIYWSQPLSKEAAYTNSYVEIHFKVNSGPFNNGYNVYFELQYTMAGVKSINGIEEARERALSWLMSKRTSFWGWNEHTPRAITALFLGNGANYNGTSLEEELMAKQTELKTALALAKNPTPNEVLSMSINSLLVTCNNPRHFYGQNLVRRLKDQIEFSKNFTHPIVYLTLCNANESWPLKATEDLMNIFKSNADYHFVKDIQAFAVMAVSCYADSSQFSNKTEFSNLLQQVKKTVEKFKDHQLADGSFGNVETTSLITQALISSGQQYNKDLKINAAVNFLIKELNSSEVDFQSVYLTLPILNGKSLADVSNVNCTGNPRKPVEGDLITDINDYVGPKMWIEYSLFVGDDKDVIHTMSMKVPENYSAYQVMRYAAEKDERYRFEWKMISSKMYVYKIGKVTNDPEAGKFWLLHLGSTKSKDGYNHTTSSPDQVVLYDQDHLIMWFKSVTI